MKSRVELRRFGLQWPGDESVDYSFAGWRNCEDWEDTGSPIRSLQNRWCDVPPKKNLGETRGHLERDVENGPLFMFLFESEYALASRNRFQG
jgi:hypothetical protein